MKKQLLLLTAGAALFGGWLLCIAPNTGRKKKMKPFEDTLIAHRGLFDNDTDAPENSIPAFRKAVESGFGIELDVQMTADGRLVVFHDDSLKRMCGTDRPLRECTWNELKQLRLAESTQRIPLFDEVLSVIDGKVPLIVEVKPRGRWKETTMRTARRMDRYPGVYCMESFHPLAVGWYRRHRPEIIRGQLAENFFRSDIRMATPLKLVLSNLLINSLSRPDFIAYNFEHANQISLRLCRRLYGAETFAWVVRNPEELKLAKKHFDVILFDGFLPDR